MAMEETLVVVHAGRSDVLVLLIVYRSIFRLPKTVFILGLVLPDDKYNRHRILLSALDATKQVQGQIGRILLEQFLVHLVLFLFLAVRPSASLTTRHPRQLGNNKLVIREFAIHRPHSMMAQSRRVLCPPCLFRLCYCRGRKWVNPTHTSPPRTLLEIELLLNSTSIPELCQIHYSASSASSSSDSSLSSNIFIKASRSGPSGISLII